MEDERESLKELVRRGFAATPRPDNSALRGSSEGDEPFLVEEEFRDKQDWRLLDAPFLDQSPDGFGSALSFFSAEAFRYFLPAYLLADLDEQLAHVDVLFHLWHGLDDASRSEEVNPRRYGGWTWLEAMTERYSGFTRPELEAIVAYLQFMARQNDFAGPKVAEALRNYWLPRLHQS